MIDDESHLNSTNLDGFSFAAETNKSNDKKGKKNYTDVGVESSLVANSSTVSPTRTSGIQFSSISTIKGEGFDIDISTEEP